MNDAKKNLLGGTIVYFIGNALISIIQFLMLPILTGKLSPESYGYFEFIIATGNLLIPFITLQITDSVFTFFFKSNDSQKVEYFTAASIVIVIGIFVLILGINFWNYFVNPIDNLWLVIFFIISNIVLLLYTKLARSLDKNLEYVKSNLLRSVLYIFFQIIFLVVFNLKVESLFLSNILSTAICIIVLEYKLKLRKFFDLAMLNVKTVKHMLRFSTPLIPNSILWWLVSSVNTFIVSFSLGMNINGIYSVANKFSSILTMVTSVFLLAWQESAIKEYKEGEGDNGFYNEVSYQFINFVFSLVVLFIPLIKIIMPYMIDKSYYGSIPYAPILLLATGFGALTGFYGSMYAATRKTIGSMYTTILGVVVNLTFIVIFIHEIGLYAPAIATLLSNLVIAIVRHLSFKSSMNLKLKWKYIIILILETILTLAVFYYGDIPLQIICFFCCLLLSIFLNKDIFIEFLKFLSLKIVKKV